jgi:hypothetical protein
MPAATLGDLFRGPEPLAAGGRTLMVAPLRVRDVAAIERSLAALRPDPPGSIPAPEDDPDPPTRAARLHAAYPRALAWWPDCGSEAWGEALATPGGAALFLWHALAPHNPGLAPEDVAGLAGSLSATDWRRLEEILWGIEPWRAIREELEPTPPPARARNWGAAVDRVSREHGIGYEAVGAMTFAQFRCALEGGAATDAAHPAGSIEALPGYAEHRAEALRRFLAARNGSGDGAAGP